MGLFRCRQKIPFKLKKPGIAVWAVLIIACLIFISILDLASRTPNNPDTAIYHAQAIHWIESYRAVPGLGNLTSRLAYNSNWLVLNALFSYAWVNPQSYHAMPGLLSLVCLFYFLSGLYQILTKKGSPSAWVKTILIPIFFIIVPSEVSSPGTDLPAVLFAWVLLCESLDPVWQPSSVNQGKQFLLGSLVVFAATIKLSILPLLLLPSITGIFYLWKKNPGWSLKMGLLGISVAVPWLARNVILSGYLIYPMPWLDLFSFDWKIPREAAQSEVLSITNWARHIWIGSSQHNYALPLQDWVPLWFKAETINRRLLVVSAALGMLIYAFMFVIKPARLWLSRWGLNTVWNVFITAFCGCLFWFLTAPDFRFGFSFVIFSILLCFFPLFFWLSNSRVSSFKWLSVALVLVLVANQVFFYQASFQARSFSSRLIDPESYGSAPTSSCQFSNFSTWCADLYNQCWYNPFPCVPRAIPSVEMRGTDFADGFRDRN